MYTIYYIQCTIYSINCKYNEYDRHILHYTPYTVRRTVYGERRTLYDVYIYYIHRGTYSNIEGYRIMSIASHMRKEVVNKFVFPILWLFIIVNLYRVYCVLLCYAQCTLYAVHCTLYTIHCTIYIYNVHYIIYTIQFIMYGLQCTAYIVQRPRRNNVIRRIVTLGRLSCIILLNKL